MDWTSSVGRWPTLYSHIWTQFGTCDIRHVNSVIWQNITRKITEQNRKIPLIILLFILITHKYKSVSRPKSSTWCCWITGKSPLVASRCHLGHPRYYFFFLRQDCDSSLAESRADHFLTLSPAEGLRLWMAGRIWELGGAAEYHRLVIILILLHLIVCSSLGVWQLLRVDGDGRKLAQWRNYY